jgi:putative ribosome biogenesis GTPase RsgA
MEFQRFVEKIIKQDNIPKSKYQIKKIIEFHQSYLKRQTTILLGNSLSGKSSIIKICQKATDNLI